MHKPVSLLDKANQLLEKIQVKPELLQQLNNQNTMISEPNLRLTVFADKAEYKEYDRTGKFFQRDALPEADVNNLLEKFMKKLSEATDPADQALQHTFLRLFVSAVSKGRFNEIEKYTWSVCTTTLFYLSGRYWQSEATSPTVYWVKTPQALQKRARKCFELLSSDEKFVPAKFSLGQILINEYLNKADKLGQALFQLLKGICHIITETNNDAAAALFVFSQVPVNYLIDAMVLSVCQNMRAEIKAFRMLLAAALPPQIPEAMYFKVMLSQKLEAKLQEKVAQGTMLLSNVNPFMEFIIKDAKKLPLLVAAVRSAKNETTVSQSIQALEHHARSNSHINQQASYELFTIYYLGLPPVIERNEAKALGYLLQNSATSSSSSATSSSSSATSASSAPAESLKLRALSLLAKDLQQRKDTLATAIQLSNTNANAQVWLDINGQWNSISQLFLFACQQDFSKQTYATKDIMTELAQAIPELATSMGQTILPVVSASWQLKQADKEAAQGQKTFTLNTQKQVVHNHQLESALKNSANLNAWLILCDEKKDKIESIADESEQDKESLKYVTGFSLVLQGYAAQHGIDREKNLDTARQLYTQAQTEYGNVHAAILLQLLQLESYPTGSPEHKNAVAALIKLEKQNTLPMIQLALGEVHCTPAFYQQAGWFKTTETLDKGISYFCQVINAPYGSSYKQAAAVNALFTAVPLDKLVDYFFTAAKVILATLQKRKSPGNYYQDNAFNCPIAKALKNAAECDVPAALYCRAEVSRLVMAQLGRNSEHILGQEADNGFLLVNDADIIKTLLDVAGKATTPQLANAALTSLEAYQREGKLDVATRYKIFLLHIGLGCIAKNMQKALECIQEGVLLKSMHPGLLKVLIEDLSNRIAVLTKEQEESEEALAEKGVYKNLDSHKIAELRALFEFVQGQNFSKCTDEVHSSLRGILAWALTLINYHDMQQETQLFVSKQSSSSSSTSSTSTGTTAVQTSEPVQQDIVGTYPRSPAAPAPTTMNSSSAGVQSTTTPTNTTPAETPASL